ncbi:putative pectinesterase 11 [Gossypium hirsutum]|uniref:pectinesterase n=1 Tax=Gossypium hirsutum TaxID=3635 RepID=A0A1U8PMP2_GOSHI|nr:putative pectinesterase 11 [Gossypium hirsutum]
MPAFIFFVTLFMLMTSTPRADVTQISAATLLLRVDQSGKGDYEKIQDAIDAAPSDNEEVVFILVEPGIYNEKIVVPADKPFITLSGLKPNGTIITGSDSGNIFESATFTVLASDFVGQYLTIQNTYGLGAKAVALRVSGDRATFFGCRILSYQDTLLDDTGRHYYSNCYIEGAMDFIFENAASLFEVTYFSNQLLEVSFTYALKRRYINYSPTKGVTIKRDRVYIPGLQDNSARCSIENINVMGQEPIIGKWLNGRSS